MAKPIYLLVTPYFPSQAEWRGPFAYDFARALQNQGKYEVVVFRCGRSYEWKGVSVHGYRQVGLPSGIPSLICDWINRCLFLRQLQKDGVDISRVAVADAFVNGLVNLTQVIKRLNPAVKLVTHHHDLGSFGVSVGRFRHFYPFKLVNFFVMRHLQNLVDLHVFISVAVKRSFERFPDTAWTQYCEYAKIGRGLRWFKGVVPKASYILPNGVNTNIFNPIGRRPKKSDDFVIGCVANFQVLKDQKSLIAAIDILASQDTHNWRVEFVGSGETLSECQRLAAQVVARHGHDRVRFNFNAEVLHDELPDFYHSLDLFVLPSYFEGFGCVYLEAWACGTPFIGCKDQGIEDMIPRTDRLLWLCDVRSPEDLAQKILNFVINRSEQKLIDDVDINRLVEKYVSRLNS